MGEWIQYVESSWVPDNSIRDPGGLLGKLELCLANIYLMMLQKKRRGYRWLLVLSSYDQTGTAFLLHAEDAPLMVPPIGEEELMWRRNGTAPQPAETPAAANPPARAPQPAETPAAAAPPALAPQLDPAPAAAEPPQPAPQLEDERHRSRVAMGRVHTFALQRVSRQQRREWRELDDALLAVQQMEVAEEVERIRAARVAVRSSAFGLQADLQAAAFCAAPSVQEPTGPKGVVSTSCSICLEDLPADAWVMRCGLHAVCRPCGREWGKTCQSHARRGTTVEEAVHCPECRA